MNEKIKEQIIAIQKTGMTNMFDVLTVQRLAFEAGYYELVNLIQEDRKAYGRFILTGM